MVWECPACGSQLAQMEGGRWHLPRCWLGHASTEMEQRLASRWMRQYDDEAAHG